MPAQLVESLLSLAFPSVCEVCGEPVSLYPYTGVCEPCESGIHLIPGPHCVSCGRTLKGGVESCPECLGKHFHFDRAFACAPYEGPMKELLHTYKFNGRKHLKHFFLKHMRKFMELTMADLAFDAVVSVPLDPASKRDRGFNQSELLSRNIATHLSIPDLSRAFTRHRTERPQHRMTKWQRVDNVKNCFKTTREPLFLKKNILLLDDILTTGQTASECARTLKESGAKTVTVLTCARGI